jgi:hypothetical protein
MRNSSELAASDDPQVGPVGFRLENRCLPLAGQILEGVSVEQRLVELPVLEVARLAKRWVGDDLPDAAAERRVRHW